MHIANELISLYTNLSHMTVQIATMKKLLGAQCAFKIPYFQMHHLRMRNRIAPAIAYLVAHHTRPLTIAVLLKELLNQRIVFAFPLCGRQLVLLLGVRIAGFVLRPFVIATTMHLTHVIL